MRYDRLFLALGLGLLLPLSVAAKSEAPSITVQPVGAVFTVGQPASLSVTATGTAPIGYQWLKDGVWLGGQTNSSVSFANFQFTNSGSYRVVITNTLGMMISTPASLSVTNAPLQAWGYNSEGELGKGTSDNTSQQYGPVSVASNVVAVAAGHQHSLFVKADGSLWAMGWNLYGALGNGTTSDTNRPVVVASNVAAMAAGGYHSLFVKADGTLWAMGRNDDGRLGNGNTSQQNSPVGVASNVVALAAGGYHSLFVKADGTLWAMGFNTHGQLGNGTTSSQNLPASVASNVVAVAAGVNYSLFVKADGTLWAMGDNGYGQLGNGNTSSQNLPVMNLNVFSVASLGAMDGASHSLAVATAKTLATVTLSNLTQTYDGTAKLVSGVTSPTNLTVIVTYNVSATAPVGVGRYTVVASIIDPNYYGSAVATLVIRTTPTVSNWPAASAIYHGQTLASSTLNGGSASVTGTFGWTAPDTAPGVGTTSQGVTFSPADAGLYDSVTGGVNVAVLVPPSVTTVAASGRTPGGATLNAVINPQGNLLDALFQYATSTNFAGGTIVSTLAGSGQFSRPWGVAVDASGNVYVADANNNRICKVTAEGEVTTLSDQFNSPYGVAVDANGNVYVADSDNHCIRKVTAAGEVTTLAGSSQGYADGAGTAARFDYPTGVAVDASGTVYVADYNNLIRKITPSSTVSLLAQSGLTGTAVVNVNLSVTGLVAQTTYYFRAVATNNVGSVYGEILSFATLGTNATVATVVLTNLLQTYDGTAKTVAVTTSPTNLAVDVTYNGSANAPTHAGSYAVAASISDACYYGSATNTLVISKATPTVSAWPTATAITYGQTLASSTLSGGAASVAGTFAWTTPTTAPGVGTVPQAVTFTPTDMTNYNPVSNTVNATVYVSLAITAQPVNAVVSVGQTASLSVTNTGAAPFGYQWLKDGAMLPGQTNATLTYALFQFINSGSYQVVITNAAGMAISLPASLSVPDAPLKAWGFNGSGQLGVGNNDPFRLPETVASNVVAAAVGDGHSLFVTAEGTLWGMGDNSWGQLGDGGTDIKWLPVVVASNVVAMAGGTGYSLFIKADGTLWGMGSNEHGQLGDGTTAETSRPVFVTSNVVAVAAGLYHSLFIKADGTLWGMGYNIYGQLGNNTLNEANPTPLNVTNNVVTMAAGSVHTLFVKADGSLWSMGANFYGQLGNGLADNEAHPVSAYVTNNVVAVACGGDHSLFIKADGTLWGMGNNERGELGNDTRNLVNPTPLYVTNNVVAVTGGNALSVFIKAEGSLWAVGSNAHLELGVENENSGDLIRTPPILVNHGGLLAATLANRGGATADHVLAIAGASPATGALTNQEVTFGQLASFTALVTSGDGPFTYQWQKDGTNLVGATAATYTLDSIVLTDAGSYVVVVASIYGSTNSTSGILTVNKATPTVTAWPTASAITYGQMLAASILSGGSASVGGTFTWTTPDATPEVGTARQEVTFTPTDTNAYTAVSSMVPGAGLILRYSGYFGPNTTLGGVALGAEETPFVIVATFDSAQNLSPVPPGYGVGIYAATAAINIDGVGTYQSAPGTDLAVWLVNPTADFYPSYAVGIGDHSLASGTFSTFEITTPQFLAETPGTAVCSGFLKNSGDALPFALPLGDGTISLNINDFGSSTPTAEILAGQTQEVGPEVTVNQATPAVAITAAQQSGASNLSVSVNVTGPGNYQLWAVDADPVAGTWQKLVETNTASSFTFTVTNALTTVATRFYRTVTDNAGVLATNRQLYAVHNQPTQTGQWYKLSLPLDLGSANTLAQALGEQLKSGLSGDAMKGDLLYVMDAQGNWLRYDLDGANTWTSNGVPTADTLANGQGFWLKRRSTGPAQTNAIYSGSVQTNDLTMTFRSNAWHLVAWPYASPWREDDGGGTNKGWGFAAAGAQKGNSYNNADNLLVGSGYYYLNTDGRWYQPGVNGPASNTTLRAFEGYYYLHRGTGFVWAVKNP